MSSLRRAHRERINVLIDRSLGGGLSGEYVGDPYQAGPGPAVGGDV